MTELRLQDRVYVVTGTSQGIGSCIAAAVVSAGGSVVGVSRRDVIPPGCRSDRFLCVDCDVTSKGAPDAVVAAALARFGRIDGLVNNAAVHRSAPLWEQGDHDVDEMFAVNVTAAFRFTQRLACLWRDQERSGVIVNIGSVESEVGWKDPPQAVYAATKGAITGITRACAHDLAPLGIRVVAVGPGAIDTEMNADSAETRSRIPLGNRFGTAVEVADVVVFFLSDQASYITGQTLFVDGGYLLP